MSISRSSAWSLWLLGSLFYAYQYVLRVMPNLMLTDLMRQFHVDATLFGQFSGVYYLGYALMHLPLGILLDRVGPRKVMTLCVLLSVLGMAPIVFSEHWIYPVIGRVLLGIGSSAAILSTFKIIRMAFNEKYFTRMLSFAVTIGLLGAIYGGGPVSYLCTQWGYQAVVEVFMALGLILAVATYLLIPDMEKQNSASILGDIKYVFSNGRVLMLCFFAGCMVGPLEGFADVWASAFLKQVYHVPLPLANSLPSLIFVGMCFGAPVLSMIAEKTQNYLACIIGAGSLMFIIFTALIFQCLSISAMTVGFVLVGVCCAYQILAIYQATTYVPEGIAALTTAVANMMIMSFGYAFHSIIGYTVSLYGGPMQTAALINGLSILPISLGIGVMGFVYLFLIERKSYFMEKAFVKV